MTSGSPFDLSALTFQAIQLANLVLFVQCGRMLKFIGQLDKGKEMAIILTWVNFNIVSFF